MIYITKYIFNIISISKNYNGLMRIVIIKMDYWIDGDEIANFKDGNHTLNGRNKNAYDRSDKSKCIHDEE